MSGKDEASYSMETPPKLHHPPARPDATAPTSALPTSTEGEIAYPQPIPPPSEPKQYRAIGLVRGRYTPSETQLNRGVLLGADDTLLDAVLLGRVISLVKNHLDLAQEHLWVVYPRTRDHETGLHLQIMGVWEPEELNHNPETDFNLVPQQPTASLQDGYFSIRGEVVYQSQDQSYIIVRIHQSPRKGSTQAKTFKLRLEGTLPDRAVGYFWDLDVQRQGNTLVIQHASSVGILPPKKVKRSTSTKDQRPATKQRHFSQPVRPRDSKPLPPEPRRRSERVEKPIKNNSRSANS